MSGKSQQTVMIALEAHEKRYGTDLAYLLNRLDEMDSIIRELEIMISRLTLKLVDLNGKGRRTPHKITERPLEERDDCHIIQF